jgi:hypothetical protein
VNYSGDDAGFRLMLRNLAVVVSNYREAGISVFLLAYFVSGRDELLGIRGGCRSAAAGGPPVGAAA